VSRSARDVQVWWAGLDHAPDLMDEIERERHAALRREFDRRRFAIGSALLRITAGAELGRDPRSIELDRTCPTCGRPHGKPRIGDGGDLEASVSHSGQRVAVALARGAPLGVDVEELATGLDHAALARSVLAGTEHAADIETFLAYWTCKEAVLKATGDGLRVPLTRLTIADPMHGPRLVSWDGRPALANAVALYRLDPGLGYLAALAVLDPAPRAIHQLDAAPLLAAF
jgi:4'-phosphopantetheinyl transferase